MWLKKPSRIVRFDSLFTLLIILLQSSAHQLTTDNASTIEYWVRPDTVFSCSQLVPPGHCITITDLISNTTNISINGNRNISIIFLPGVHVPKAEGWIIVGDMERVNNVVATISGTPQNNVTIHCETGKILSFIFFHLVSLTFSNMIIYQCGFGLEFQHFVVTASFIARNVLSLTIDDITINESRGAGMVISLTRDTVTSVNIYIHQAVINNCTGTVYCTGNMFIEVESCDTVTITIEKSILSKGQLLGYPERSSHQNHNYPSGGLTLQMLHSHSLRTIRIENCEFTALHGGGMKLILTEYTGNIHVTIINSVFSRNTAYNGAGIYISCNFCDSNEELRLNLTHIIFKDNQAVKQGGAIFAISQTPKPKYWLRIECYDCVFENTDSQGVICVEYSSVTIQRSVNRFNSYRGIGDCSAIHINHGDLTVSDTIITNNECRGLYLENASLTVFGTVIISNGHAENSDGGAIYFSGCSLFLHMRLPVSQPHNHLDIINNTADGHGGGIAVQCERAEFDYCFFANELIGQLRIRMINNTARHGGHSIYTGNLRDRECQLMELFHIVERTRSSVIASPPYRVCICSKDFTQTHNCTASMQLIIYPGERFQIPIVCVGQYYNYSSECTVQATLETKYEAYIEEETEVNNIALDCKILSHSVQTHQTDFSAKMYYKIVSTDRTRGYESRPSLVPAVIQLRVKTCPPGFKQEHGIGKCICNDYLASKGITCSIDEVKLFKTTSSMWIGNCSGAIVVHQNCPFDYCKSDFDGVDPYNQQEQCDFNRSGIMCSACQPGLSLVLGTSQCKQCPNIYLLLLIPFTLAGVLLIILLLKCNMTVSTGTINGLIFYANVIHATQTAYFPTSTSNTFVHVLSIFIAWLNLDLGIETCFIDGLNTYYKTWLQFAFPLYIWTIVGSLILISRHSITVSRWTGSNTVSVLATLFLLSYTKLLRTTFDIFSSTVITDINGKSTSVWLLNGHYTFLQWPHSLLFTAGLATLLAHILPFTLLLLTAPVLQRYSHHRPLRWVNKVMPLLDAYQGPYKVKFRYWTGLLLLARLTILTAVSLNVTGNQGVNLLMITIVLTLVIWLLMIFGIASLYRDKFNNFLELFFLLNLLMLTAVSQFSHSNGREKNNRLSIGISFLVGGSFIMTTVITSYHCIISCLKIDSIRKMKRRIISKFERPRDQTQTDDSIATNNSQHSAPTVTIVELQEPLLDENPSQR